MSLKQGQNIDIEIVKITNDGQGVGLTSEGTPIIIDNVDEDDDLIQVEITSVLEESVRGKKINKGPGRHRKEIVKSDDDIYPEDDPLDEGEEFEDEE